MILNGVGFRQEFQEAVRLALEARPEFHRCVHHLMSWLKDALSAAEGDRLQESSPAACVMRHLADYLIPGFKEAWLGGESYREEWVEVISLAFELSCCQ